MSALPPKADITESDWHVRFVPKADIHQRVIASMGYAVGLPRLSVRNADAMTSARTDRDAR
jgi:hypothetical protein